MFLRDADGRAEAAQDLANTANNPCDVIPKQSTTTKQHTTDQIRYLVSQKKDVLLLFDFLPLATYS